MASAEGGLARAGLQGFLGRGGVAGLEDQVRFFQSPAGFFGGDFYG